MILSVQYVILSDFAEFRSRQEDPKKIPAYPGRGSSLLMEPCSDNLFAEVSATPKYHLLIEKNASSLFILFFYLY